MTRIKFAIIWGALYAVLVAAVTCFIAWGVPDFGAMPAVDRLGVLFVYVGGAAMWSLWGASVWWDFYK
jgi:hypothetical protein